MIRAAFFDVDGTLLPLGTTELSEKTVYAMTSLKKRGIKLAMATGRGALGVPKFKVSGKCDLIDAIQKLGVIDATDAAKADFTPLVTDDKYLKDLSGIRASANISFYGNDNFIKEQEERLRN